MSVKVLCELVVCLVSCPLVRYYMLESIIGRDTIEVCLLVQKLCSYFGLLLFWFGGQRAYFGATITSGRNTPCALDDLVDLRSIVSAISAVLLDAEGRSVSSNLVKDCLEKLKDALYNADDLLDDIHTEALRKDLLSGNKLTKEHLQTLVLEWSGDNEDEEKSLEDLQPHPNMKKLVVNRWNDCPLTSMPLYYPSLDKKLKLVNTSLRPLKHTIHMNITPSTSPIPLSKSKSLKVENFEELDPDVLEKCLQNMTSLDHLDITSCHWLKSLYGWLQHLASLKSLKIRDCKELNLEGMQWELLMNLFRLVIVNIPQLVSPPLSLQHLVQLRRLEIGNCSGLKSLFPSFQHITSLEELWIHQMPHLEKRCGKDIGTDWHKIARIPKIWVNGAVNMINLFSMFRERCSGYRSTVEYFWEFRCRKRSMSSMEDMHSSRTDPFLSIRLRGARLNVAMFNAIFQESANEIRADPGSDPIVEFSQFQPKILASDQALS
ncbi:hypothetical protein F3Y22_tig00000913pilonHSYRG00023 [Hibiscus syriacus]|uniref:Uncharacterized protein n=1 Tax=Hibiscus syriacus TaxID=106335 RepID=A0A6A3D3I0_HIBSY|nr:hypothetical protein F3Y22_tig00000913pilonHSYRG00023 [Hibiscus syriacus]